MLCMLSSLKVLSTKPSPGINLLRQIHLTPNCDAARKGTREKARKKKVKVEVKKVGFIAHNLRNKDKLSLTKVNKHIDDSWKAVPKDDCYVGRYYKWRVYSVAEAIQCHRETHHPTMYNLPNAPLNIEIELNMQAEKSTRFVDNFQRMAMVPHKFDHGEDRKILVFTKNNDSIIEARNAGATLVGGVELIKDIQSGELQLSDYQYIIAHPIILPELVTIRGLMKRKFPNPKSGTLGPDLVDMITKFLNGISYSATRDENQQDFGKITTSVGYLNMDKKHLEENLISLLKDVNSTRPKREGQFITRVLLKSPPSGEQLKIDPFVYIPVEVKKSDSTKTESAAISTEEIEEEKYAVIN